MTELVGRGERVLMVNRSGEGVVPEGVDVVAGDAADRNFCREICRGAGVVYQCLNPPYDRWPELFPRLQAGVLEGAAHAEAKLVSMENMYLYGLAHGEPFTEKRPYTAMTHKGRVRADMAQTLHEAHKKGRVRVAMARASDFFGPGVVISALGARVFRPALRGAAAGVLGNIDLPHTYTYVPDIGKALVLLGERDEALGQTWHIPSPETVTTRQVLDLIYAETGHPTKVRAAGKPMVRFLGLFNPQIRELNEMMYEFTEPFILDSKKFTDTFGDISTPLPDAIRQTVDWFRDNPA